MRKTIGENGEGCAQGLLCSGKGSGRCLDRFCVEGLPWRRWCNKHSHGCPPLCLRYYVGRALSRVVRPKVAHVPAPILIVHCPACTAQHFCTLFLSHKCAQCGVEFIPDTRDNPRGVALAPEDVPGDDSDLYEIPDYPLIYYAITFGVAALVSLSIGGFALALGLEHQYFFIGAGVGLLRILYVKSRVKVLSRSVGVKRVVYTLLGFAVVVLLWPFVVIAWAMSPRDLG